MSHCIKSPRLVARATPVALGLAAVLCAGHTASAVPIVGQFLNDIRGDVVPNQLPTHELGEVGIFPVNESIQYSSTPTLVVTSVPNDGNPNDWNVRMGNSSGIPWMNLFFVCDQGATVGNADGVARDVAGAPGIFTDAFRIDGTVTPGINVNLLSESMIPDEIFQPGEIWEFLVTNFNVGTAFQPPIFQTPGVFAGSSNVFAGTPGNASILASPVPEPTSLALAGLGGAALLRRRRSR